ncbi:MAG: hypothetical protein J5858_08780, partial [Lentisphaeria bacterium]|nr:hypothetical protein [Lentisphaeria bacterium]
MQMNEMDNKAADNTADVSHENIESSQVPAITQPDTVIFPFALSPLVLDSPANIAKVEKAALGDRMIVIFPEMPENTEFSEVQGIELNVPVFQLDGRKVSGIGVLCRLVKTLKFPDGTVRILLRGLERVR